ncbi:hypothetical protein I4641_18130 [Waterburya agarophytonicola K14]|uniref:Uncharacterized protein n=1 Tax=Waterburya agarophytonicola KI4 TaxID=2874699 RepID=A0A964BVY6_9CYAN|nr:hypothetical protein [Waterburya agarophytonicola]MCC0178891.1 hypothetical protein [Waterburya agarophytonicola KI4]
MVRKSYNTTPHSTKEEQEQIYDHLLYCVKTESPVQVLERFNHLFIKATGYQDNRIRIALENIVDSNSAELDFPLFFNRCCHIIVNRWQIQVHHKPEIIELVLLLERSLPPGSVVSRNARKLRQLIKDFITTEYFIRLQRLARLIDGSLEPEARRSHRIEIVSNSVGDLIQRYPYLHQHCLLTEGSTEEFQQTVETIQAGIQSNYELNLSQYITHRVRLARLVKKYKAANKTKIPKRLIQKVDNPTLLSDLDLDRALRHYMGKVEKNHSYYDLSQKFLTHTTQTRSYREFKGDLYEYIVSGVDSRFGERRFNNKLYDCLQNTMTEFEDRELDEFLTMRTYCQLFKFLVVDGKGSANHERFLDLITYLGEVRTIGLLLKLVLLCEKVKPYLEQRFSILFSHYEAVSEDRASWLVKSLENLQVAFSVHFGEADFSLIQII